jgi:hypothetical protein
MSLALFFGKDNFDKSLVEGSVVPGETLVLAFVIVYLPYQINSKYHDYNSDRKEPPKSATPLFIARFYGLFAPAKRTGAAAYAWFTE